MHVGSLDWQCAPEKVCALGALIGVSATMVPGAGHMLATEYVGQVLDLWLQ